MDLSFNLKMQGKQFENEAKRLQREALKERSKAKAELKKGNRAQAALYAQNAVRLEEQSKSLLQNSAAVGGYAVDVRAAEAIVQSAATMTTATRAMEAAGKKVNMEQLSLNRHKMDGVKQRLGAAHQFLTVGEGDTTIEAGANDLLDALEHENEQYALMQMDSIPQGIPSAYASGRSTGTSQLH
jgi:charged multivesicular body protein 1